MKTLTTVALCALSLVAGAAATAVAQTEAPARRPARAGDCIVKEQADQIIATLTQRNQQLVTANNALGEAQQRVAELETKAAEAETAKKALDSAAAKNRELVGIGKEILKDYEEMDLGRKTAAREPVTQLYRVRLENTLQKFEDEIAAKRVFPERELEAARQPAAATPTP